VWLQLGCGDGIEGGHGGRWEDVGGRFGRGGNGSGK
jgi:hypothetical protein